MQIDMHYYGTYALARCAGLTREAAHTIAHSAQFVDDNVASEVDDHDDGAKIFSVPTAHHAGDLKNREPEDQRYIWVPFHFLPANEGTSWTEKLICRKDSAIAQEMVTHHINQYERSYALELMGITAHVYADTFAHYGFSGVSSRRNRVKGDSFMLNQSEAVVEAALGKTFGEWIGKYGGLLTNIRSHISSMAETYSGSLGHGAVASYPDLPFLEWSFIYEQSEERVFHNNPLTYLEGAEKLHAMFRRFALYSEEHQDEAAFRKWDELRDRVRWIFAQKGDKEERSEIWKALMVEGNFGPAEEIPEYDDDLWNDQAHSLVDMEDSSDALDLEVHRFYRAADYHQHYVLRELLPRHRLLVV